MKSYDAGLQTDVAILDFSKAFDTVPHNKLLHKLDDYGVRGSINRWLEMFLIQRKMKVVIDGDESEEATVDSGVPQGTVLGPLLFLYHINDLPDSVSSSVKLFADDCLLYGNIRTQDHTILQEDLQKLEVCAKDWGMRLNNAKKCYILRDRPFNLKGGYGFLFRPEFFFRTTQELKYFVFVAQSAKFCSRI
jgi:hypothetical protein